MSSDDNVETTKKGYAAFAAGDLEGALQAFDDDVEWIQPGKSTLSGTYHGKGEVVELLTKIAGKQFGTKPNRIVADGDVVVALTDVTIEGENSTGADVFTFRDGKIVKTESFGDTALTERIFGVK
jgi:ketosteroid isomerase-like protein